MSLPLPAAIIMARGAHVNGIHQGFTAEARSTQRKAFSFAGRYRQMKRCCPGTFARRLVARTQDEFARGSIFACRYLPTGENKIPLCALWYARISLADLYDCKVSYMLIARSTCSCGLPRRATKTREVGRSLGLGLRGERERASLDNEGASPNASEPDSASLHLDGGGQPSRDGEACHQWGRNEREHLLGRPG